jgi:hypothetical protein
MNRPQRSTCGGSKMTVCCATRIRRRTPPCSRTRRGHARRTFPLLRCQRCSRSTRAATCGVRSAPAPCLRWTLRPPSPRCLACQYHSAGTALSPSYEGLLVRRRCHPRRACQRGKSRSPIQSNGGAAGDDDVIPSLNRASNRSNLGEDKTDKPLDDLTDFVVAAAGAGVGADW